VGAGGVEKKRQNHSTPKKGGGNEIMSEEVHKEKILSIIRTKTISNACSGHGQQ